MVSAKLCVDAVVVGAAVDMDSGKKVASELRPRAHCHHPHRAIWARAIETANIDFECHRLQRSYDNVITTVQTQGKHEEGERRGIS